MDTLLATCATALNKKCSDWFCLTLAVKDKDPNFQLYSHTSAKDGGVSLCNEVYAK